MEEVCWLLLRTGGLFEHFPWVDVQQLVLVRVLGPTTVLGSPRRLSMALQLWALCLLLEGDLQGATSSLSSLLSPQPWVLSP